MRSVVLALVFVAAVLATGSAARETAPDFKLFDLSLPRFTLSAGERVVGYECTVRGGRILRIDAPDMWDLTLENGIAGSAKLGAHIIEGVAAFEPSNLNYFERFLTIGRTQGTEAALESYFNVNVVLLISRSEDETNPRKLAFTMNQLKLSPRSSLK
jgi:hypothetical protein